MGVFLPEKDLKGLKEYKYSSIDKSLVSKYILKPFYTWFVTLFPTWVAPNLITLSGLLFTISGVFLVMWYNPNFDKVMPWWVYAWFGADFFLYQTFDAVDGLQARRTSQSSPLGELFDHTIDAINTSLGVIIISSVLNISPALVLAALFLATLNFYLSTWEEFHTGTLYLSVFSGPVEGVLMIIGICVATAFTGPAIWSKPVAFGLCFVDVWIPFSMLALTFNVVTAFGNVLKTTTKSLGDLFIEILPFAGLWASIILWLNLTPHLLGTHMITIVMLIGLIVAMVVGRIITAHVTNSPKFPMWNPLLFIPAGLTAVHLVAVVLGCDLYQVDPIALWISLGLAAGVYGSFVAEIIMEITTYLDIGCLYIKDKKD